MNYMIVRCGKYLQGIEPNPTYVSNAKAPTMGTRHSFNEYRSIWGREKVSFERLTAANYIKTIFEEYRWGYKKPEEIRIIPRE